MTHEEQFEQILDEALVLVAKGKPVNEVVQLFPDFKAELLGLLGVAVNLGMVAPSRDAYAKMFGLLPTYAWASEIKNMNMSQSQQPKKATERKRFFWLSFGSIGFALVVGGFLTVRQFVRNQRVVAYSSAPTDLQSAPAKDTYRLAESDLGTQYAAATGLASTDVRVSNPVSRALYAVYTVLHPENETYNEYDATDTREYMKTGYNATICTRHIQDAGARVQTIIRGYGGRLDRFALSNDNGYVSFVVPVDHFEEFKNEVKSVAGARFIAEAVNMTNKLSQKQTIETQTAQETNSYASIQSWKNDLAKNHAAAVAMYARQLSSLRFQINNTTSTNPDDPYSVQEAEAKKNNLQAQYRIVNAKLAQENSSYEIRLSQYNEQLKTSENNLANLDQQNTNLLADVATVDGTITFERINIFQVVDAYLPYYWIWLPAIVAIALYVRKNKRTHDTSLSF